MNKFFTVLKHTFLTNIKSKTFIIATVVTSLVLAIVFSLPGIISYFDKDEVREIGVIDLTNEVYEDLQQKISVFNSLKINLLEIDNETEAKKDLDNGDIEGYLIVNSINDGIISATYKANQVNDSNLIGKMKQGLTQVQFRLMATSLGLTQEQASQLFQTVSLEKIPLDENAKSEEEMVQSRVLVYILLFAIYFGVLMFGNLVAMEVAKEKSSRVMEILISSVNPITQMFGKILGVALLGLLQSIIFIGVGYLSMQFGEKSVNLGDIIIDFSNIPSRMIAYAIIFFVLGYLLFATIAAMLGSLVSRIEEMQQMLTPLTLTVVAAFLIAMSGLNEPEAGYIVITSYIPIFTPMIMFLRVGMSNPATWEIFLSLGILIVSIIGTAIFAAKVYHGGVLMYGKGGSFKDLLKALSVHKDSK